MGNDTSQKHFSATYIAIAVFNRSVLERLIDKIEQLIREGQEKVLYNVGVQRPIDEGVRVGCTVAAGLPWAELGHPADPAFAPHFVLPKMIPADLAA